MSAVRDLSNVLCSNKETSPHNIVCRHYSFMASPPYCHRHCFLTLASPPLCYQQHDFCEKGTGDASVPPQSTKTGTVASPNVPSLCAIGNYPAILAITREGRKQCAGSNLVSTWDSYASAALSLQNVFCLACMSRVAADAIMSGLRPSPFTLVCLSHRAGKVFPRVYS